MNAKLSVSVIFMILVIFSAISASVIVSAQVCNTGSVNVLVTNPGGTSGGPYPYSYTPQNETTVIYTTINATLLANYDTFVMWRTCEKNMSAWTDQQKTDIVKWVENGGKLIIWDTECTDNPSYTWLPYPITTNNPGGMGATGWPLTIIENNTLSNSSLASLYYIDTVSISSQTDAVGDANILTVYTADWCVDMDAENVNQVTGPVHVYSRYGSGLMIYSGLDANFMGWNNESGSTNLTQILINELNQQWGQAHCGLPCLNITLPSPGVLNVTKTSDKTTYNVDDNVIFTLIVSNRGNNTVYNVSLTDFLPGELTSSGPLSWNLGNINAGDSITKTVNAIVVSCKHETVENIAVALGTDEFGNTTASSDKVTITVICNKTGEIKTTNVTVGNVPPYIEWQNETLNGTLVTKCAVACDNNSVDDIVDVEGYIYDPSGALIDHEYLMLAQNNSTCWQMVDEQDPDFYDKYMIGICDLYEGNYTLSDNAPNGTYTVIVEVNDTSGEYGNMTDYFNYIYIPKNHTPFVEWIWELPDEDNFTNGTQVYPVPGGSKIVTKCVIACDPNGAEDIVDVEADVYYPNGTLKEHEHLNPALNSSMCWQTIPTEDEEEFWDKYNRGICDIYSDTFTMEFWEKPGDYLVDVEIHDASGDHAHMDDTFEYMPCIAIDNDANIIDFGSVVPGSLSNVTGDNDMATLNAPTLRNICNVPANISVTGTNLSCTTPETCNAATIPVPIIGFDVGVYNCSIPGTYGAPTLPIEPGPMSTNLENFQLNIHLGKLPGSYQGTVVIAGIQG